MADDIYEAESGLAELLGGIKRGRVITVTRHGVPVARIAPIPVEPKRDEAAIERAIQQMDEIRARSSLRGLKVKDLINEGRR